MRKLIEVNKSLKKEVVFLGLKAKFIYYGAYLFIFCFIMALFGSSKFGPILSLVVGLVIFIIGVLLLIYYSKTYGENGWVKKHTSKSQPNKIRVTCNTNAIIWTKQKISEKSFH